MTETEKERWREGDTVQNVTETKLERGRYSTECDRKRDEERERQTKRGRYGTECHRNRDAAREVQYRMSQKQRCREGGTVQIVTETEMERGRYSSECHRNRDEEREVQYLLVRLLLSGTELETLINDEIEVALTDIAWYLASKIGWYHRPLQVGLKPHSNQLTHWGSTAVIAMNLNSKTGWSA